MSQPITHSSLFGELKPSLCEREKVERVAFALLYVTITLIAVAIVTALIPLFKSLFSGTIQYSLSTIVVSSASGTAAVGCLVAFIERYLAAKKVGLEEVKRVTEPWKEQLAEMKLSYNSKNSISDSWILALSPDIRIAPIRRLDQKSYKNLLVRVCNEYYDLRTKTVTSPSLIADLKTYPNYPGVVAELRGQLPHGFLNHFN